MIQQPDLPARDETSDVPEHQLSAAAAIDEFAAPSPRPMAEPVWLDGLTTEAGRLLGLPGRLVLPAVLVDVFADGPETLPLDGAAIPEGRWGTPAPEFGTLGADMAAYFAEYEFAEYMPGAWPLVLDGAGGFYCLDVRAAVTGVAANDGSAPLVWGHAGSLGWAPDDHVLIAPDVAAFFAAAVAERL